MFTPILRNSYTSDSHHHKWFYLLYLNTSNFVLKNAYLEITEKYSCLINVNLM